MNRLKELRLEKGLNMKETAAALNLPYTTYVSYEKSEREPNSEALIMFADYYNTTTDYILGVKDAAKKLNVSFNPISLPGIMPMPRMVKKPRLGVISCGEPINSEENFDGYDDVPENIRCDFTLKCEGDSMIGARILNGDIVYIRQQPTVENGQIAAVMIDDGEKLLKRVYIKSNSIVLQAENPAYEPKFFIGSEMNRVKIIGRAVGFTSVIK